MTKTGQRREAAGVSRRFFVDLEEGHERAELGKTLAILAALGLSLAVTGPIPRGSEYDPARRDYAQTFTQLIDSRDYELAIKMLAVYATASLKAGRQLLQRSPRLKGPHWSAALAGITNYTAHRLGQLSPSWTRRIRPLDEALMPAEPTEGMLVCEGTHDLRAQVVLQKRCPDVPRAHGIDPDQTAGVTM